MFTYFVTGDSLIKLKISTIVMVAKRFPKILKLSNEQARA